MQSQCVFTSEDSPCEHCQHRGFSDCVKLGSQHFNQKLGTGLRPSFEDVHLCNSIFSTNTILESPQGALFHHLKINRNPIPTALRDSSLVFAVLAWSARVMMPSMYLEQLPRFAAGAVYNLNICVTREIIHANCVYASNLIAWVAYSSCLDEVDPRVNFQQSLGFLRILLERRKPLTNTLEVFGPFIIDCANAWTIRNGIIPGRSTTFRQRTEYFDHLRLKDNVGAWHTGILEAANATLGNLLEVSLTCACQIIRKEIENDLTRDTVDNALQHVRAELGDVDLHQALRTLNQSFQGPQTNHTSVEGQLITRIFHRLRCVLLLLTILEASSIEFGVLTPKAKYIGERIIYFCQKQAIHRDGPIEDYFLTSWHNFSHLLLGGMCISPDDSPECN